MKLSVLIDRILSLQSDLELLEKRKAELVTELHRARSEASSRIGGVNVAVRIDDRLYAVECQNAIPVIVELSERE